jgi:hypothetical protein
MTVDVAKAVGNYAEGLYYGVVDSSGYLVGATATAPVAGVVGGSAMAQLKGLQDFPFTANDPDMPSQRGDAGALARFINRSTELPGATLTMGAFDYGFAALCQALEVDDSGGGEFLGGNPYTVTYADLCLLVVSQAKSLETASAGSGMFEARMIHRVNMFPKLRTTFNDNALPSYEYNMVANYASRFPWGRPFTAADDGDTSFVYTDFTWPYRPIVQRWTGDNATVSYELAQNIAEDSATNIIVYQDGVALTWATGAPGAGEFGITEAATDLLVFGTAPTAASVVCALYGWS